MVTIMGTFLFHEKISLVKVGGIALIILGVVALNLTERSTTAPDQATAQLNAKEEIR
jgi:drug/metabolite transporter (DMT)-like permease